MKRPVKEANTYSFSKNKNVVINLISGDMHYQEILKGLWGFQVFKKNMDETNIVLSWMLFSFVTVIYMPL